MGVMTQSLTVPAPRRRPAEATKRAIVAAACELFVEFGFDAVSLRDIATRAGITHPAILRHFRSQDELLRPATALLEDAVAQRLSVRTGTLEDLPTAAEANGSVPGYLQLFSGLAAAATRTDHPAHAQFQERYAVLREEMIDLLRTAQRSGELPSSLDVQGEGVRMMAAWDGLQTIALYLPDVVDIPAVLRHRLAVMQDDQPGEMRIAATDADAFAGDRLSLDDVGYPHGRTKRLQILERATELFARAGFHTTTLREIAAAVGVSKSTMLHYFPTKAELLIAVLALRDEHIHARTPDAARGLAYIPAGARRDAVEEPGLIALYATLSTEAVPPTHPAHAYFARRYQTVLANTTGLFSAAGIGDTRFQALWLVALWEGLQIQWLYAPNQTDIGAHLQAHLASVAPELMADTGGSETVA